MIKDISYKQDEKKKKKKNTKKDKKECRRSNVNKMMMMVMMRGEGAVCWSTVGQVGTDFPPPRGRAHKSYIHI